MTIITNAQTDGAKETTSPGQWVDAHGDYLFNFAVGQIRDPSVAEDLVQETFLAAFKARARFAGNSSERTWLVGILRHKIYDHLRHTCRERAVRADANPAARDEQAWDNAVVWLHDVAAESAEPHQFAILIRKGEVGKRLSCLNHDEPDPFVALDG